MDFKAYQNLANDTIQHYDTDDRLNKIVPFLGIIGEAGSVVSELKKSLRDGTGYVKFSNNLKEELGDVLWYISTIATQNGLCMEEVATGNVRKIQDRFLELNTQNLKNYDDKYPEGERFPREFEIDFESFEENGQKQVRIINKADGKQLGDALTDNAHDDDGYRFHDIFHFGYVAHLGWSPVVRSFLSCKRKSIVEIDENEDGARAKITEELVSLFIYNHAQEYNLHKDSRSIDTGILTTVKQLVSRIEIKNCSAKQWEVAILNSYQVFNELRRNDGGSVRVSLQSRSLTYLGKKQLP